jgi:hypothetical protein
MQGGFSSTSSCCDFRGCAEWLGESQLIPPPSYLTTVEENLELCGHNHPG